MRHEVQRCRLFIAMAKALPLLRYWIASLARNTLKMIRPASCFGVIATRSHGLARTNQRGSLVFTSTCPPLIGVGTTYKQNDCGVSNQSTLAYLKAHPEIHTVVMAAIWSGYFKQGGVMTTDLAGTTPFMDLVAAQQVLLDTVQWLHDTGRHVILVGPVPIFDTSVPLALALERHTGQKFLQSTEQAQNEKNAVFLQAAQTAAARFPLQWLDPIQWMCGGGGCLKGAGGVPSYRDSHHLSVAGALQWVPEFERALLTSGRTALAGASAEGPTHTERK